MTGGYTYWAIVFRHTISVGGDAGISFGLGMERRKEWSSPALRPSGPYEEMDMGYTTSEPWVTDSWVVM